MLHILERGTPMPFDAFISYSTKDKLIADAACAALEARGVRCWIAPRDILPGEEWPASIVKGISASRIMVLIYSGSANESPQIKRELERAVHGNMPILPYRIEAAPMSPSLQYLISTPHWLDAIDPPMEANLKRLGDTVVALLAGMGTSVKQPAGAAGVSQRSSLGYATPPRPTRSGATRGIVIGTSLALALIVLGVLAYLLFSSAPRGKADGSQVVSGPGPTIPPPPAPKSPARVDPTPPLAEPNPGKVRAEIFMANGDSFAAAGRHAEAVLEFDAALREFPGLAGVAEKRAASMKAAAAAKPAQPDPSAAKPPAQPIELQPLIFAAVRGNNLAAARDILKRDKNQANVRDKEGKTPLHVLAEQPNGTLYMTRLLTDNGADHLAKDNAGRTPYDLVKESGNKPVRAILEQLSTTRPSKP
jgi:hypothetical protein